MNKSDIINIKSGSSLASAGILKIVLISALGIIGVALVIKMVKNARKVDAGNEAIDNPDINMAMQLNTAIHPARSWVGDIFTGANKDEIFALAQYIKKYDVVANEYQKLYDESLSHELQDAMGDEYPALLEKLGKVKAGTDMATQEEIIKISDGLYKDMNGANWTGRDLTPYSALLRLTDSDFKKVISLFNSKHSDFREFLDGESGTSVLFSNKQYVEFSDLQKKILIRYDKLY
jgi:hypothetical protein